MIAGRVHPVELTVGCGEVSLPVVMGVVENSVKAMGAGEQEALRLVLATEEIFTHLTTLLPYDTVVKIRCATGLYYFSVELSVPKENIDLRAFNITATVSPESEASLEEMGLVIASRSVDSLRVERETNGGIVFRIVKERAYPEVTASPEVMLPENPEALRVEEAAVESLKLFAYLINRHVPSGRFPGAFRYPGKLIDMVKSGDYGALVARDDAGAIGGGVFWRLLRPEMAECFGPYCFVRENREGVIRALLDGVLGRLARSSVLGLINRYHPDRMPPGYFEELGTVRDFGEDARGEPYPYYFRLLHEDAGSRIWAHPEIESFLRETTQRLILPREIMLIRDEGEHHPDHSVISTEFERPARRVTLSPLWIGKDMAENLSRHVQVFLEEGLVNILFGIDLGVSEEALWVPILISQQFIPKVILPYAGRGDLLIFQYDAARS